METRRKGRKGIIASEKGATGLYFQRPRRHEEQGTVKFLSNGILGPFIQA